MKLNTKRMILSAAGLMLSVKDALAEDMMDKAVNSLDPSIKTWAAILVTLIRAAYIIGVGGGVFYYVATYYLQRKQGHTTQASEAKTMFLEWGYWYWCLHPVLEFYPDFYVHVL